MHIWVSCFVLLLLTINSPLHAAEAYDAFITKVAVPEKMILGRNQRIKVTIKNTGSSFWNRGSNISLGLTSDTNKDWRASSIAIARDETIKPDETKTVTFLLNSVPQTGVYSLQFELRRDGKPFGQKSLVKNVVVETRSNRVDFISQLLPNTMNAGQKYSIVVQLRNEGTVNWTRDKGYKLGLKSSRNIWSVTEILLDKKDVIAPGETATFRIDLQAPNEPGIYDIQWQMQRWSKWFGEPTPKQQVAVSESSSLTGAEFVYQRIPELKQGNKPYAIVERGAIVSVNVTFKNTSDEVWTEGRYSLNSQNPPNNLTWSVDRIDLKPGENIRPGQIKAFNFKVIAPLKPGIYHFQWQMVQGFNTWIGEKSEDVVITVK